MATFTQVSSGVKVAADGTVVATAKVKAGARTAVTAYGVACRDEAGRNVDFAFAAATITTTGTVTEATQKLPTGTYSYWPAVQYRGKWYDIGVRHSFTVQAPPVAVPTDPETPTTPTVPTVPTVPAGNGVPTAATAPAGWELAYVEDFATPASAAEFTAKYAGSWAPYTDTDKYFRSQVHAADSCQIFTLAGGKGAAGVYGTKDTMWGRSYGRFGMRFKAEGATAYGTAIMLWMSSDFWPDGEMDIWECGSFGGTVDINHHTMDCPNNLCYAAEHVVAAQSWQEWHVGIVEWEAGVARYYLDGKLILTVTKHVPTKPHRHTIQIAKNTNGSDGRFLVDWVAHWDRKV